MSKVIHTMAMPYLLDLWDLLPYSAPEEAKTILSNRLYKFATVSLDMINMNQFLSTLDPLNLYDLMKGLFQLRDFVNRKISAYTAKQLKKIKNNYGVIRRQNLDLAKVPTAMVQELTLYDQDKAREITLGQILLNNSGVIDNSLGPVYKN